MAGKNWIQGAVKKPGALTDTAKSQGAFHGGKIDSSWLDQKAQGNSTTAKRARLAQTFRGMNKGGGGGKSKPNPASSAIRKAMG